MQKPKMMLKIEDLQLNISVKNKKKIYIYKNFFSVINKDSSNTLTII